MRQAPKSYWLPSVRYCQTSINISFRKLTWSLVFAASSTSLLFVANQTATAAPQKDCQSKNILSSALSSSEPENQSGFPCITTSIDSFINSDAPTSSECRISKIERKQPPPATPSVEDLRRGKRNNAPPTISLQPASGSIDLNPSSLRSPLAAVQMREGDIESQPIAIQNPITSGFQFESTFFRRTPPEAALTASACTTAIAPNEPRSQSNPLSPTLHEVIGQRPVEGRRGLSNPPTAQRPLQFSSNQLDGELGELRLREVQGSQVDADPELGRLRIREIKPQSIDPELGRLRVREVAPPALPNIVIPPPSSPQLGSLLAQIGYFQTNNIFSGVDPVEGGLLSTGATLITTPKLGPDTDIIAAIDGSLIRYIEQSESNYHQFRVRAGIRQQLSPRMYGEIGWINQQLFRSESGDRFLHENAVRFVLRRRDRLTDKLRLDSFYELRVSNADPETRSRIINSLAVSLSYNLQNNFLVGLDYQYALSDFTQREREDEYHRILGRLSYAVSPSRQVNLQGGVTLGGSSDPNINFDNFFLSVTYTIELGSF